MHWLLKTPPKKIYLSVKHKVVPNLGNIISSEFRRCRCCEKRTIILHFTQNDEVWLCLRCRANQRYEMLASFLRGTKSNLGQMSVLELDRDSPLKPIFEKEAAHYVRTFFNNDLPRGTRSADGAEMQDITNFGFEDESFDLIVSSEVLEHVPNLVGAFQETHRILRPGGKHIFTIPPSKETKQLAKIEDGEVVQIVHPPEYHGDPLGDGTGILTFWHLGPEFPEKIDTAGLTLSIVSGPMGTDGRVIWCAERAV